MTANYCPGNFMPLLFSLDWPLDDLDFPFRGATVLGDSSHQSMCGVVVPLSWVCQSEDHRLSRLSYHRSGPCSPGCADTIHDDPEDIH